MKKSRYSTYLTLHAITASTLLTGGLLAGCQGKEGATGAIGMTGATGAGLGSLLGLEFDITPISPTGTYQPSTVSSAVYHCSYTPCRYSTTGTLVNCETATDVQCNTPNANCDGAPFTCSASEQVLIIGTCWGDTGLFAVNILHACT